MLKLIPLITAFLFFHILPCSSQHKLALSVYAGSGISAYGGPGAAKTTIYNISDASGIPSYVSDPYGKKPVANAVGGIRAAYSSNNWIFSLNTQYEYIGGEVDINKAQSRFGLRDTTGTYQRMIHFLSVNPQAGRILLQKKAGIIANAGIDYAFNLGQDEEYSFYDANGQKTLLGFSGGLPGKNDLRLTAGIMFTLKKWALDLGYKHGIRNLREDSGDKVYSRLFHCRLLFRVWQSKK